MYSLRGPTGSAPPRLAPIWRANRLDAKPGVAGHPTGFPTLDAELPDRGWPRAGLVEILSPNDASAAWSLLAPWLCRPAVDAGPILCLSPPHEPYAPALQQLGIPLERLFLVRAETAADTAWAAEQALQVIACTAILLWVSTNIQEPNPVMLRRIHLASVAHPTPVFVFGHAHSRRQGAPAPLRVSIEQAKAKLAVAVIKRRGPPMTQPIELDRPILDAGCQRRWQALTFKQELISSPSKKREVRQSVELSDGLAVSVPAGFAA